MSTHRTGRDTADRTEHGRPNPAKKKEYSYKKLIRVYYQVYRSHRTGRDTADGRPNKADRTEPKKKGEYKKINWGLLSSLVVGQNGARQTKPSRQIFRLEYLICVEYCQAGQLSLVDRFSIFNIHILFGFIIQPQMLRPLLLPLLY